MYERAEVERDPSQRATHKRWLEGGRQMIDAYNLRSMLQKQRVAVSNMLRSYDDGDESWAKGRVASLLDTLSHHEEVAEEYLIERAEEREIFEAMCAVKGVGPVRAACLIAQIDFSKADTVSSLWRYAGYGVRDDGTRDRPIKGERLRYRSSLKKECYLLGVSLLRCGSPYADEYYRAKRYYTENRDWTDGHIHMASLRKMIKLFLSHTWEVGRMLEGLEIRRTYVEEHLGHDGISTPQEYGWPEL